MQISDLLRMCAENLRRRKARSLLTIIGVVVGTCSIVIMMSFGIAIDKAQDQMINRMGDLTQINIYNNAGMRGDMMVEGGSAKGTGKKAPTLDDRQLLVIRQLPGVVAATPYYTASLGLRATAGSANRYVMQSAQLTGAYMDELPKMGFTLLQGSFVKSADISAGEIPVLVGEKTAYGFMDTRRSTKKMVYPEKDVQGNIPPPFFDIMKTRLILSGDPKDPNAPKREIKLRVVGVLKENFAKGHYTSQGIIMDIKALQRLERDMARPGAQPRPAGNGYDNVAVVADSIDSVADVEAALKEMGYSTFSMQNMREEMKKSTAMIRNILGGIGAISMFVAALSIANTMTMAIYERTREIGVMKVLGCKIRDIRAMFLVEAGLIGFLGGLIGMALSFAISFGLNALVRGMQGMEIEAGAAAPQMSVIPLWLVLLGLGFATFVGVLSGLAPSNRAVKISAMEALHHN